VKNSDEAEWDAKQYANLSESEDEKIIQLFKLHGSLNWRERKDGTIVRVSPEEMTRKSRRYKRNLVIYPAEKYKPEIEPFKTLHELFLDRFTESRIVIFLGFSFRDEYLNSLFRQASKKKIIIILPHASEFLKDRAKSIGFKQNPIPINASLGKDDQDIYMNLKNAILGT
jgi:hypothetical protein